MTNGGISLSRWLDPKVLIVVFTVAVGFVGQWYVSNDNVKDQQNTIQELRADIRTLAVRIETLERIDERHTTRLDFLSDLVTELRRLGGLRSRSVPSSVVPQ